MTGQTLNFGRLKRAIATLDAWYHERGVMGLVSDFSFDANGQVGLARPGLQTLHACLPVCTGGHREPLPSRALPAGLRRPKRPPCAYQPPPRISRNATAAAAQPLCPCRAPLPQVSLNCAEAVVNSIQLRFVDAASHQPKATTRTKPHIVTRHLTTKPGEVGRAGREGGDEGLRGRVGQAGRCSCSCS